MTKVDKSDTLALLKLQYWARKILAASKRAIASNESLRLVFPGAPRRSRYRHLFDDASPTGRVVKQTVLGQAVSFDAVEASEWAEAVLAEVERMLDAVEV